MVKRFRRYCLDKLGHTVRRTDRQMDEVIPIYTHPTPTLYKWGGGRWGLEAVIFIHLLDLLKFKLSHARYAYRQGLKNVTGVGVRIEAYAQRYTVICPSEGVCIGIEGKTITKATLSPSE